METCEKFSQIPKRHRNNSCDANQKERDPAETGSRDQIIFQTHVAYDCMPCMSDDSADERVESLRWTNANLLTCWLRLENLRKTSEWVDAFA